MASATRRCVAAAVLILSACSGDATPAATTDARPSTTVDAATRSLPLVGEIDDAEHDEEQAPRLAPAEHGRQAAPPRRLPGGRSPVGGSSTPPGPVRRVLAEEGVVVVVVTVDIETGKVLVGPEIITRGWVYAPEAEDLLDEACDAVSEAVETTLAAGVRDVDALERDVRRAAGRFVNERTKRRPMIVPVVMEI